MPELRNIRVKIIATGGDPQRKSLTIIKTVAGDNFLLDEDGNYWRTYIFVENARTYDKVEKLEHVYNATKAFGRFLKDISDLPGTRPHETIPDFHNTPKRFDSFIATLGEDAKNRAKDVQPEIGFILAGQGDTSVLLDLVARGECPLRVTHNDTKFNNVLFFVIPAQAEIHSFSLSFPHRRSAPHGYPTPNS